MGSCPFLNNTFLYSRVEIKGFIWLRTGRRVFLFPFINHNIYYLSDKGIERESDIAAEDLYENPIEIGKIIFDQIKINKIK